MTLSLGLWLKASSIISAQKQNDRAYGMWKVAL